MNKCSIILGLVLCFLIHSVDAQGIAYNPSVQFDTTNNPSILGPWSYGHKDTGITSAFVLYNSPSQGSDAGGHTIHGWDAAPGSTFAAPPNLGINDSAGVYDDGGTRVDRGEMTFYAGTIYVQSTSPVYSVLRFIAPEPGNYQIKARFDGDSYYNGGALGTTADVYVLRTNATLFAGMVNGFNASATYNDFIFLNAADTVDFVAGINGANSIPGNDVVGFTGLVAQLPTLINPVRQLGQFTFSFTTTSNITYQVQYADNLDETNWTTFTNVLGNGLPVNILGPSTNNLARFYRVRFN